LALVLPRGVQFGTDVFFTYVEVAHKQAAPDQLATWTS
jgi:hypothetical protein